MNQEEDKKKITEEPENEKSTETVEESSEQVDIETSKENSVSDKNEPIVESGSDVGVEENVTDADKDENSESPKLEELKVEQEESPGEELDKDQEEENADESLAEEVEELPESAVFLIGRKIGMTRVFDGFGNNLPVTIVNVNPNIVTQIKKCSSDGYSSVQIASGDPRQNGINKPHKGKFAKMGLKVKSNLKEFRITDDETEDFKIGSKLTVNVFSDGDIVNVTGVSQGKGFTGHMKRHGFHGGRRSHGKNSVMRKAGAVGASADPARIWPGKLMAGRSGGEKSTVKNLTIVRVDSKNNNLYIKGAVPGANDGIVYIEA